MKSTFQEFLTDNRLQPASLPDPIQRKIRIFREMEEDMKELDETDRSLLADKMEALDQEIWEDLMDEYEDRLTNNEVIEPKRKKAPNEVILANLYQAGKTRGLSRTYLRSKGLNVDFSRWEIPVGPYLLHRQSVFHYHFRLTKN